MRKAAVLLLLTVVAACSQPPAPVVHIPPASDSVVVAAGDTVYAIARRHGVSMRGIIDANALKPPYVLRVGQRLSLPRERVHEVAPGETLYEVSRRYGVDMAVLARANGLRPPYPLIAGRRLRIPAARIAPAVAPKSAAPIAATSKPAAGSASRRLAPIPAPKPPADAATRAMPAKASAPPGRFLWPVRGEVIARFGRRPGGLYNEGINIAAPKGTPVKAAADGVVAYAGNQLRGYGQLVLVRHPGGWVTAYAHNDAILVRAGQRVRRGEVIARVGASGRVGTPQSHFEIRRGTEAVDPETLLASP